MQTVITESQLNGLISRIKTDDIKMSEYQKKYDTMSKEEKQTFVEIFEAFNPQHKGIINEASGWNTFGDIIGIFDPTGIVDVVNGLSYLYQGDYFFGMLSMVSAVPYVGDLVAKPIMMAGKGSKVIKSTNAALKMAKAGKTVEAGKVISDIAKSDSMMGKLMGSVRRWAPKLKSIIDKIPGGKLSSGLRNTLKDWITLFEKVGAGTQKGAAIARRAAKKTLTPKETIDVLKQIQNATKQDARLFRSLGGDAAKGLKGMKNYKMSGMPRLFGNKATRSLMIRTKFWAGFLDWLGVANFVGPEELQNTMKDFDEKMNEYSQTPGAKKNWEDEFSGVSDEETTQTDEPTTQTASDGGGDFTKNIVKDLLFGPITGAAV